jgi:hypothetical protein
MGLGAGLSRTQFTLLSPPGAASGATSRQGTFWLGFHNAIMNCAREKGWSILTVGRRRTLLYAGVALID